MDDKLKKEIKDKYDRAKMVVKQLNSQGEFEQTISVAYVNSLEKELREIDKFFSSL